MYYQKLEFSGQLPSMEAQHATEEPLGIPLLSSHEYINVDREFEDYRKWMLNG